MMLQQKQILKPLLFITFSDNLNRLNICSNINTINEIKYTRIFIGNKNNITNAADGFIVYVKMTTIISNVQILLNKNTDSLLLGFIT